VLDKLESFASHYGPDFYGLPRNTDTITLSKESWLMPESIQIESGDSIVPFYAGQELNWKII